jgi:hypothetical protein
VDIADQYDGRADELQIGLAHEDLLYLLADLPHERLFNDFLLVYSLKYLLNVHKQSLLVIIMLINSIY